MTPCEQEKNIEKLMSAVYGNGKIGMITQIELIKDKVNHMDDYLEKLATSYKALAESQIEYDTTQKLKANTLKQISLIFGIAIPLTALILKLL